jgi:hypothetical protein
MKDCFCEYEALLNKAFIIITIINIIIIIII